MQRRSLLERTPEMILKNAIDAIKVKVNSVPGRLGNAKWNRELNESLLLTLDSLLGGKTGPCTMCTFPGHDQSTCWIGAQLWKNAQSRQVNVAGESVNAWSRYRMCEKLIEADSKSKKLVAQRKISALQRVGLLTREDFEDEDL